MGLIETSNKTYLSISDGKIAKRVKEKDPEFSKAVKCTNKEGTKTWHEVQYKAISGKVIDIFTRVNTFGNKDLNLLIKDGEEIFQLQMSFSSRYANGFLFCMPNIDFSRPIIFSPWCKTVLEEGGKQVKKTMLYLSHDEGKNIDWAWNKDNPGEMPPMVQVKVKGQLVWDDSDRQAWLEKYMTDNILPKLKNGVRESSLSPAPKTPGIVQEEFKHTPDNPDNDPVPF